jgi:hypothetical protein
MKITVSFLAISIFQIKITGCTICFGDVRGHVDKTITSRYMKWSAAELPGSPDRPGKPLYSKDPLKSFINHLLYKTHNKKKNLVFSHYGGRYDSSTFFLYLQKVIF